MSFTTALISSRTSSKSNPPPPSPQELEKQRLTAASPPAINNKDVRAYEHDRHRVRKAADLVKMRTRKEQTWTSRFYVSRDTARSSVKTQPLTDDLERALDASIFKQNRGDLDEYNRASDVRSEVPLADLLISTRKPRKERDGDFEVIPPIRSVIVLDEAVTPDLAVEEPWEHIYGDDDDDETNVKAISYATIAAQRI